MTAQPLREDMPVLDLTTDRVIVDGPWVTPPPGAVLSNPDALAPAKKKRKTRKKKATGKPRGRPAKPVPPVEPETPPANLALSMNRVAPAGDGIVSRFRRVHSDDWLMVACAIGIVALAGSLAFVVFG